MKTLTIKKLDVLSVAMFAGVLSAVISLVAVVTAWVLAMVNYAELNTYFPGVFDWNTGFGILAIVLVPLLYFAIGWVTGAVVAWFYNVALSSGGVKVDVEE